MTGISCIIYDAQKCEVAVERLEQFIIRVSNAQVVLMKHLMLCTVSSMNGQILINQHIFMEALVYFVKVQKTWKDIIC